MATFYGNWRTYGSGAQWRLILEIDSPPTVTRETGSVSLSARLKLQTTGSLYDSVNSNSLSGTLGSSSGSTNVSHGSGGGTTTVCTVGPTSVSTVYGSSVTVTVNFAVSGYEALQSLSASQSVTIPARPYYPPQAPTGVSGSRNSDTSQTVTWTRNLTEARPYQSQRLQRRVYGPSGLSAWVNRATLSGTATSYTDTTTYGNRFYQYRVVAVNTGGSTTSSASGRVYTSPGAPSSVSAAKSGADIRVTIVRGAVSALMNHEIQHSTDAGGSWSALATVSGYAETVVYTHTSPDPADTHRYRVRTVVDDSGADAGHGLASTWRWSPTVLLAAPPNAPTGLGPASAQDAATDVALVWSHNPVDTSPQEEFTLRHREVGGSTWVTVGPVSSGVSSWTLPGGTYAGSIEWQVQTRGQHASFSPWSAVSVVPLSGLPTAAVNAPADAAEVNSATVTVEWGYYDPEGAAQTGWQVELLDASGAVVEFVDGADDALSVALETTLPDGSAWSWRVRVRDGVGLWSGWDEAAFTVAYPVPPVPTIAPEWDADLGTVEVGVSVPDPEGDEVEAVHVDLWRSIGSGPWVLVAAGLALNTSVTDYAPAVAGVNRYRASAVSALPSRSATDVYEVPAVGAGGVFVSGGPGFSQVCQLRSNVRVSETGGRVRVLRQYAGRTAPLEHSGEALGRELSLRGDLIPDSAMSTPEEWRAIADLPGPHLWRDPDGRYLLVSLSDVSVDRSVSGVYHTVSVSARVVDAT